MKRKRDILAACADKVMQVQATLTEQSRSQKLSDSTLTRKSVQQARGTNKALILLFSFVLQRP